MKNLLIISLLILSLKLFSQVTEATHEQYKAFMKTTTYVVLEDMMFSDFNMAVEENIGDFWKITPVKIIRYAEFKEMYKDSDKSFLMINKAVFTKGSLFGTDTETPFKVMSLVLGDRRARDPNKMPDLASCPLSYDDVKEDEYAYKIGGVIQFIQYFMKFKLDNPKADVKKLAKKNNDEINKKELWFLESDLNKDVNTLAKIKKYYPYKVKIVSKTEIEKAIAENNPNVALLHKIGPEGTMSGKQKMCWKFIFSAKDGKPLYYSFHKISDKKPDAFLAKNFSAMAK